MNLSSGYINSKQIFRWFVIFVFTIGITNNVYSTNFTSATGSQASTAAIVAGVNDQEIIKVTLVAGGGGAALYRCRMDFTMQNTNNADISNAKLYYTATTNSLH